MKIAEATCKIILYTAKKLTDGKHPVMLRITYRRARRYFTLPKISAFPEAWNFELGRIEGRGRACSEENKDISKWEAKADLALDKIRAKGLEFTFDRFQRELFGSLKDISFFDYLETEIQQMKEAGRFSSVSVLKPLLSQLRKYHPKPMRFADFDYGFLKGFETHLRQSCSINGTASYLCTLKASFNRAVKEGYATAETNPFKMITIHRETTRKRALTKDQMAAIINYSIPEATREFHSRQFYIFSYFCRGINFGDMAQLTWAENIREGRIVYTRSKTRKAGSIPFSIGIRGPIKDILDYYRKTFPQCEYIFPILKKEYNLFQTKQRINDRLKQMNDDLRMICTSLGFESANEITFYSARHTWATVQKRAGSSTEVIQEGLGHKNKIITETYLAQFETEVLDNADDHILSTGTMSKKTLEPIFKYSYLVSGAIR